MASVFASEKGNKVAQIHVEKVLYHLDHDLKRALEATIQAHFPGVVVDRNAVYKTFLKQAYKKCRVWEDVPDECVQK